MLSNRNAEESRALNDGGHRPAVLLSVLLLCALTAFSASPAMPLACQEAPSSSQPLPLGEKLVFKVEWNPPWYLFFLPAMEAGNIEVNLVGETQFGDRKALKITFAARSSGALVKLAGFKIDDYYEFLTDPETFCTFSAIKREREGKRKRDIDVLYFPESRRLHIKETDQALNPPKVTKDLFVDNVPACVQDVLSAVYCLRMKEIGSGTRIRSTVGYDDRFMELESRVEKKERLQTPSGQYDTWRMEAIALLGKLFRTGGQFKIWLTADARKIPVQFEAKVSLGKVTGRLSQLGVRDAPVTTGADHKPSSVSPQP